MSPESQIADGVTVAVSQLTITSTQDSETAVKAEKGSNGKSSKKKNHVAESWEDEEISSSESEADSEEGGADSGSRPSTSAGNAAGTQAPPPTPISSDYNSPAGGSSPFPSSFPSPRPDGDGQPRRPEKTDAVARRMIASALGVKVPKQTEDQKAYDKAMREKERKRREEEHEAEKKRLEEVERAKKAIWED